MHLAKDAPEACSGCLAVRRTPDGFLELRWAAPGDLTADPRVDKASPHAVIPQPSFVCGLPPATRLRIHTPMPLDEKLAYIYTYAHDAEAMDLYCEAPHVPDLEHRLVTSLAPAFTTLRSFRLLHNAPLESQPSQTDGVCGTTFEWVLPQLSVLTHLHTFSSYLTPNALRNLPPKLEHIHIDTFRSGSEFCDPEAVLAVFEDHNVDFKSLRTLTVCDDGPEAIWSELEVEIKTAARARGVRFEWRLVEWRAVE